MALETRLDIHNILKFIDETPVPENDIDFFRSIPHLKHYFESQDAQYTPAAFFSVYHKTHDSTSDLFFARTIASEKTIPHRLLLLKRGSWIGAEAHVRNADEKEAKPKRPFSGPETPEVVLLFDLRDGMNGFTNTAHGGSMCALLDETLGMCAEIHRQKARQDQNQNSKTTLYTAQLNVSFLAPVQTPGVVRVKAWMVRREGRKWSLKAQMDDGFGKVLLETESLWISTREEGML